MGHHFSLILDREVTEQETVALKEKSGASMSFATVALPTDAEVAVTRITFEDDVTATLAEAIEAGFEAVRAIPGITIPGLSVPAQPAADDADDAAGAGEVAAGEKTEAAS
ncbi:hypothetical protein [Streptomyces tsukubensis]|uniref:hypothetical protein n=1 Tax=Streptomyces tsukubensis TaxID=83656 RepID=UPI00344FF077